MSKHASQIGLPDHLGSLLGVAKNSISAETMPTVLPKTEPLETAIPISHFSHFPWGALYQRLGSIWSCRQARKSVHVCVCARTSSETPASCLLRSGRNPQHFHERFHPSLHLRGNG